VVSLLLKQIKLYMYKLRGTLRSDMEWSLSAQASQTTRYEKSTDNLDINKHI
jgi:hypothetical protein